MACYQELGLVFQKTQFRFVSCHKEAPHWIIQLNQFVFAFDNLPWVSIIFTVLVVAPVFVFALLNPGIIFWNACFTFTASIMDQSCGIFQKPGKGQLVLVILSIAFFVLSNEYKGDNITNLTT